MMLATNILNIYYQGMGNVCKYNYYVNLQYKVII